MKHREKGCIKGQVRHGDVLITPIRFIPKDARKLETPFGRVVLARGESSGKEHTVLAPSEDAIEAYEKDGVLYLHVHEESEIAHLTTGSATATPDHETLPIRPGIYKATNQWEQFWEERRKQID